ncbi:hydrogenase expression/formation protein HypE [Campylobacter sp. faydin G-140]|uniref:hydrogenase expression/formation protein HypE n=1 Tax=Campylobacter anatolicus TaxID=2829105 RepID=UPI001B9975C7|nr:hydrogenase expression/formation protein HypE [Campylobacter anatolicus]MBR8465843.1 hydrogenase expression/formation protein HypE [Campylobacter anatolicus]
MLSHGGGGEEMNSLINETIFKIFNNDILRESNDSAVLKMQNKLAFSTDSFVVTPIFFSGGDIGKIAACGTINDLAMVGAKAKYLSCALIIEEGLELSELKAVLDSLAKICRDNDVKVVCGDTKVVPKGKCDKIFINTSGIGEIIADDIKLSNLKAGAKILLSGDIGRHGAVILANREELKLNSTLQSDCKSLKYVVEALIKSNIKPQCMRDATRGGLSAVLNEWAKFSGLNIFVREENIKVSDEVLGVCELFGFEPYELANEGTFVLAVDEADEVKALEILHKFDTNAAVIGEVMSEKRGRVIIQNAYGSKRFLEPPKGELLPRIC